MTKLPKFTIIDLFAGCGGFSQGFEAAGFKIIAANEFWEPAQKTYVYNHSNVKFIKGDITLNETKNELYDTIRNQKINVIIGGTPCQAYSVAGNRNPNDPRGQLYLDFAEIIDHLQPDFFVMENVKGLTHMKHLNPCLTNEEIKLFTMDCIKLQRFKDLKRYKAQRTLSDDEQNEFLSLQPQITNINNNINKRLVPLIDKIMHTFNHIGYKVNWKILNAANYGVAQLRERVIFIGTKHKDMYITFPAHTHHKNIKKSVNTFYANNEMKQWIPVKTVLKKYESMKKDVNINHIFTKHSPKFIEQLSKVPIGKNLYENYKDAWWRLDPNQPAKTVKANNGGVFIHYKFNRVCTPRELAALQSFNDSFKFLGTKSDVLKQIGNAVPPLLSKAIASHLQTLLTLL